MKIDRRELLRLLEGYSKANKSVFTVVFTEVDNPNLQYSVTIEGSKLFKVATKLSSPLGDYLQDSLMVVSDANEITLPYNVMFDILSVEEVIYTKLNQVYTRSYYNALDPMQVYLPLFRVYGEQVVFLYRTLDKEVLKCFYINGRVFYTTRPNEGAIDVRQCSLRDLVHYNPGTILSFERLDKKLSYKVFYSNLERYAKKNDLSLRVIKNGMNMKGGI